MTSFEHIAVHTDGPVLAIRIHRPEVMNALHPPAHFELHRAFDHYAQTDELRVAVITGSGERAFCAGSDLKVRSAEGGDDFPATGFAGLTERFNLYKPVVAAVNGVAVGGGLEIVLACDLAIAAEHASFGLPEPRVGLAAAGGLHRLARQLPMKQAMEIALTGGRVSAQRALEIGIVNRVVAADRLDRAVETLVAELLACAPLSLMATKQMMHEGLAAGSLRAAHGADYLAHSAMLASGDAVEGSAAFLERRSPVWKGR